MVFAFVYGMLLVPLFFILSGATTREPIISFISTRPGELQTPEKRTNGISGSECPTVIATEGRC
jgi:hypothetical protein